MLPQWLLAWIRVKRRGSAQLPDDSGLVISTRLRELLQVNSPAESASTQAPSEDDDNNTNRGKFGT